MIRRRHHDDELVCREAVQLMSDYLDGVLSGTERDRLEAHLAECPPCTEFLAQLRITVGALGAAEPDDLSDEALETFVALYRQWREPAG